MSATIIASTSAPKKIILAHARLRRPEVLIFIFLLVVANGPLVFGGCWSWLILQPESAEARIGFISFSFVICKAALEAVTGRMLFGFLTFRLLGHPVAVSHAGGIVGSLLVLLLIEDQVGKKKGVPSID